MRSFTAILFALISAAATATHARPSAPRPEPLAEPRASVVVRNAPAVREPAPQAVLHSYDTRNTKLRSLADYAEFQRKFAASGAAVSTVKSAVDCSGIGGAVPPEMSELARALKYSPDLIYQYVYDNIETLPQFNSVKGALGALTDRAGTAFDQAELMVCLLQQSGHDASYLMGQITLSADYLHRWLGVDASWNSVYSALSVGHFPAEIVPERTAANLNPTVTAVSIAHVWVRVSINGQYFVFDPATKNYGPRVPVRGDLAAIMQYNGPGFLAAAKSGSAANTRSTGDLASLNRGQVVALLSTYARNLQTWLQTHASTASTRDIVGGARYEPLPIGTTQRLTALPHQKAGAAPASHAVIPASNRTTLSVTLPGAPEVVLNSAQIYGRRLSIWMRASGLNFQPQLLLDGVPQAYGTVVPPGTWVDVRVRVSHNYGGTPETTPCGTLYAVDECGNLSVLSSPYGAYADGTTPFGGGTYILANTWGLVGRGMIERHRKLLARNRARFSDAFDENVLGESLAVLGHTWSAQTSRVLQLSGQLRGVLAIDHHGVGIVGMRGVDNSLGPFVDLPMIIWGSRQLAARPAPDGTLTAAELAHFYAVGQVSSSLESTSIEQTQPGIPAASTTKILDLNASAGDPQSSPVFDINNPAINYCPIQPCSCGGQLCTGASYYTYHVRPQLAQNGWSASDLTRIDAEVARGNRVLAPLRGTSSINAWRGTGYLTFDAVDFETGYLITGGLSGGVPGARRDPYTFNPSTIQSVMPNAESFVQSVVGSGGNAPSQSFGTIGDPVNQVTGDFTYEHDDLSVGSGDFPYSLTFKRIYDSSRRDKLPSYQFGRGWTHNFDFTAYVDSDGFEGMGANSPVSGAAAIAALYVAQDVMSGGSSLDRVLVSTMVAKWLTDQLTNNVVVIAQPATSDHFIRLSDGRYFPVTYAAEFGSPSTLEAGPGAGLTMRAADGTRYEFSSSTCAVPCLPNLAAIRFPSGPVVTLSYLYGFLTSVSNGMGRTLYLGYSQQQVVSVDDDVSRVVRYAYNTNNTSGNYYVTSFTDTDGHATTFAYDEPGRLQRITGPAFPGSPLVTNTYDALGRIRSQIEANGRRTDYFFAGSRTEMVSVADIPGLSTSTTYHYTSRGRTRAITDALGFTRTAEYDSLDRLVRSTNPEGDYVEYTYDARSNPLTIRSVPKPGWALAPIVRSYTYHPRYNKATTLTDPLGRVTTNTYDEATGNLLQVTYPTVNGQTPVERFAYNARGQVVDHWTAAGTDVAPVRTHSEYSSVNESLSSVTDDFGGLNLTARYAYDSAGNRRAVTRADGRTVNSSYDGERRLRSVIEPFPFDLTSTTTSYFPGGNVRTISRRGPDASSNTVIADRNFTYTKSGLLETETGPTGRTNTYFYDEFDRAHAVVDAEGRTTTFRYDALGRLIAVFRAGLGGALEQHAYSPNGLPIRRYDARGQVTTYTYDGFDRLLRTIHPDGSQEEVATYDANGNVLLAYKRGPGCAPGATCTARGAAVTAAYDEHGRNIRTTVAGLPTISTTYDSGGRVTAITNGTTTYRPVYDSAWRIVGSQRTDREGRNRSTSYLLDAMGQRTRLTWPDGYFVTYEYDEMTRLREVREGGTVSLARMRYDGLGRRISTTYGNGAVSTHDTTLEGNVARVNHAFRTFDAVTFSYAYNNVHQRIGFSSSVGDFIARPAPKAQSYWVNPFLDQYLSISGTGGTAGQVYEPTGNLQINGGTNYVHDPAGRLIRVSRAGGVHDYSYDELGNLARIATNGATTLSILTDGENDIAEYDAAGNLRRRFVYGAGVDELLAMVDASGARRYFHQDALGSVVAVSDAQGATERYTYGVYGETASAAASGNPFRFAARRFDAGSGLYYNRARFYDPEQGRFIEPDPIGYAGGANLYVYANNDPVNVTDPSGNRGEGASIRAPTTWERIYNSPFNPIAAVTRSAYRVRYGHTIHPNDFVEIATSFIPFGKGASYADDAARAASRAVRDLGPVGGGAARASNEAVQGTLTTYVGTTHGKEVARTTENLVKSGATDIHIGTGTHGRSSGTLGSRDFNFALEDEFTAIQLEHAYPGVRVHTYDLSAPSQRAAFDQVAQAAKQGATPGAHAINATCYSCTQYAIPKPGGAPGAAPAIILGGAGGFAAAPQPPGAFARATVESMAPARHGFGSVGGGGGTGREQIGAWLPPPP